MLVRILITAACISVLGAVGCANSKAGKKPASPANRDVASLPIPKNRKPIDPIPPRYIVTHRVQITTTLGTIVVGLYGNDAPQTVANFLRYVDSGFYTGTVFHRVIPGFMIQGGGFDQEMNKVPTGEPIRLEIIPGFKHIAGVVAMARTNDPNSATAQFFICVNQSPQLNGGYAAFGQVEQGYRVAEKIVAVPTTSVETEQGPMDDVPQVPVIIEEIIRK